MTFQDNPTLGRFTENVAAISRSIDAREEEIKAQYERIAELKASLAEMLGIYWGEGDGIEPAPQCIQRAWAALGEEVR
jgi:hypothetical protein